ncbi:MAG: MerR family transcriptional regulator [Bacteroidota bacterium]
MTEDEKTSKMYYSIGEVASLIGVSTSLLRFWENEFPHIRPKTNKKGDRRYRQPDIDAIKQVYTLVKEKGYTLQGAREYLQSRKPDRKEDLIENLQRLKAFLEEMKGRFAV